MIRILQNPNYLLLACFPLLLSYYWLDLPLAIWVHHSITPWIRDVSEKITEFGVGGYYLLGFSLIALMGRFVLARKILTYRSFYLLSTVLLSGIFCDIIKIILGRSRPNGFFSHQLYGFYFFETNSGMWSFPSGHATTITAIMLGLTLMWPRYWPFFSIGVLLISLSRILREVHYLSDVMAGIYIGAATSYFLYLFIIERYSCGKDIFAHQNPLSQSKALGEG